MAKIDKILQKLTEIKEPNNLNEALEYFKNFQTSLYISYCKLILNINKKNNKETLFSEEINELINESFKIKFDKEDLLQFIKKDYIDSIKDNDKREIEFNYILNELVELKNKFIKRKFNTIYILYDEIFKNKHISQMNYLVGLYFTFADKTKVENYPTGLKFYFDADTFYNHIINEIDSTIEQVNKLYSKRELNQLTTSQTNQSQPLQPQIKPIQLNLEQRQIIYLFQNLIEMQMLNETNNPNLWHLVSQYFTDKSGNTLNNIHQNKDGLQNSKTGKPKKLANEIQTILTNTKNSLE